MSNIEDPVAIARDAVSQLYSCAQSSMVLATLDECANPDFPAIKLEYTPSGSGGARCLLTFHENDDINSPPTEISVPLKEVADAIMNGHPLLTQLLISNGYSQVAQRANERGFAEICTLESAMVHGYRFVLRHDSAQQMSKDMDGVDVGPAGYALRITPPRTFEDRTAQWFSVSQNAIAAAVANGESLFKQTLLDNPQALRFISGAVPEVERVVLDAGIGAAPKHPSRSI